MEHAVLRYPGRTWTRAWGVAAIAVATLLGTPAGAQAPDPKAAAGALAEADRLTGEIDRLHGERKFDAAIQLAERALSLREKALGPEHRDVATALTMLALLHEENGDHANAEPLFQRALIIREKVLGPKHLDVAASLGHLGGLYYRAGDYAKAEPMLQLALVIREGALGPEHRDVALSLNNLALLYEKKGDYANAEPRYQRALAIWEKELGPEHPQLAAAVGNLGTLYYTTGDYAQAEPLLRRALAIREKARGPEHLDVATPLGNLAALYQAEGDYANAELLLQRARDILEKTLGPEHPGVTTALNNLAALYKARGDLAKAEPLFQRALTIREKALGPEHPDVATSLNNLAALYDTGGDHARAEPLYQRALTIRERALGPEHPEVATSLNNLATLHIARGDHAKAEPLLRRAITVDEKALGPVSPSVATSLNNLAALYRARGEYAKAEPLYQRALTTWERLLGPEHPRVGVSLGHLATLYLAQNDTAKAARSSAQAAEIEDRNAAALLMTGSDEQKRATMDTLAGQTSLTVSLHAQHSPGSLDTKRLALTMILRRKGLVLEAMAESFAALRRRLAPEDQRRLDELGAISARYSALAWRGPERMPLDAYRTTLARLDEERQRIEADIGRRSAELQSELRPVTLEQVQAAIPEGASLVELFRYHPYQVGARRAADQWGNARYVAYVLRRGGDAAWTDLGEAAPIEAAVDTLLLTLRRPAADPRGPARALDALVMQPVRRLLGETRRVFLSPDGSLNLVPFAALLDEEGHYLVERYGFTYLTSGRELVRFGSSASSPQPPVVLAAPDFGAELGPATAPAEESQRSTDMGVRSFGPLAFAADEGRAIGARLPGVKLLMGADATESAVKALHRPRLLHIATHGFFLPNQPELHPPPPADSGTLTRDLGPGARPALRIENPLLRSGLAFAGVNRGKSGDDDGVLTALEASQLDLYGTKLVVLSACQTGVGEARSGDGVYGLRRALVMAGSETQVMSLWKVDDAATRELMEGYYGRLIDGGGRSEAMRQVQLAMLQDPGRAHPYYWASFIVSGNPAALDGRPVTPDFARVTPGPRGCGCEVGAGAQRTAGTWAAALAALCLLRWLRRPRKPSHHVATSRLPQ